MTDTPEEALSVLYQSFAMCVWGIKEKYQRYKPRCVHNKSHHVSWVTGMCYCICAKYMFRVRAWLQQSCTKTCQSGSLTSTLVESSIASAMVWALIQSCFLHRCGEILHPSTLKWLKRPSRLPNTAISLEWSLLLKNDLLVIFEPFFSLHVHIRYRQKHKQKDTQADHHTKLSLRICTGPYIKLWW